MSQTILITGGAGYIGSQTNFALLEQGFNTIIFDNLSTGNKNVIPSISTFVQGDLQNIDEIRAVFTENKIDGVVHFAASIEVGESQINPQKYYINNVVSSLNLFKVMLEFDVKNLVFSSTAAVYGTASNVAIKEEFPSNPINVYGQTKLMIENILTEYHKAYQLNSVCLRYFNACGGDIHGRTGENHKPESHLIPIIFEAIQGKRQFIAIYGDGYDTPDGTCIRDYIHTMDLAVAHVLSIQKLLANELAHEVINLGTEIGFSVKEIIKSVEEITGFIVPVKVGELRSGDPDILIASNRKAKKVLGWTPKYSDLKTIISTAWKWSKSIS